MNIIQPQKYIQQNNIRKDKQSYLNEKEKENKTLLNMKQGLL